MDFDDLFQRARRGDRDAWNALLAQIRPLVRALFQRQLRQDGDASDLTQRAQMRMDGAFFDRFKGETPAQFWSWVRTIVARLLIDHYRRARLPVGPLPPVDPPARPVHQPLAPGTAARLTEAVERLREPHRTVVRLTFFDELKDEEIARRLERTPVWVRVTRWRGLKYLREDLRNGESSHD
jgi:RNA polymerase sigma-70 factor (ECF subfamily)